MATTGGERGRLRRAVTSPVLLILLIAPLFGEGLSGSSAPLELLTPWHLAFMAALYGCGALVCREVAHRFGLGFTGLILLGVAYAVWEEALVDRYWFFPRFWEDSGIGTYSAVWHTNVLLAVHLTVFHAAISVCASILCVSAHWILIYTVAETGLTWPVGVTLALSPVAAGLYLVPRLAVTGPYGGDGVRVVVGLLTFFVLLDLLVALVGRYDMILSALLTAWLARWLYTRRARVGFAPTEPSTASP
jgi:hypothetical protein